MPDVRPELDEIGWRTMRLLAASDIHGNHDFYRWIPLLVQESKVDAVVLAGDLLGFLDETTNRRVRAEPKVSLIG